MENIIDGQSVAEEIESSLETDLTPTPTLTIVNIGDNKASEVFIEKKIEACKRNGFETDLRQFPEKVEEEKVLKQLEELNNDSSVHGILVQLPLPPQISNNKVFRTIRADKDVDGLTPENIGKLLRGDETVTPCAVSSILEIITREKIEVKGKDITIINNSNLIGKPLSMALTQKNGTVKICNKDTEDLELYTQNSDIIITATGVSNLLKDRMVPDNSLVIDAGFSFEDGELESESENISGKVRRSPVPGGVGPITVAMTLRNLLKCYRLQD